MNIEKMKFLKKPGSRVYHYEWHKRLLCMDKSWRDGYVPIYTIKSWERLCLKCFRIRVKHGLPLPIEFPKEHDLAGGAADV